VPCYTKSVNLLTQSVNVVWFEEVVHWNFFFVLQLFTYKLLTTMQNEFFLLKFLGKWFEISVRLEKDSEFIEVATGFDN
jgi:hypothetical protein